MAKVLGIGGLFFRAENGAALGKWYADVLGLEFTEWGGVVFPADGLVAQPGAATVFHPDAGPDKVSPKQFSFNLVVDDLDGVLARCKAHGVEPSERHPDTPMGQFAQIIDPAGHKIELWEPKPMDGNV